MGKGKHNMFNKVRAPKQYEDDYTPKNKTIRKRINNNLIKKIKNEGKEK